MQKIQKWFLVPLFIFFFLAGTREARCDTVKSPNQRKELKEDPFIEMLAIRAEQEISRMEMQKERTYRNIYIAGISVLIGFIFFIYRNNRLNKKLNQKLGKEVMERTHALQSIADKLMKSEKRLLETNKELESFIYRTSHDLKGPLSSAKGLVNLAMSSTKPDEVWEYLRLIRSSIDKLDSILITLYEVTVIRKGVVVLKEVSLPELIDRLVQNLSSEINYDRMKFCIENDLDEAFISDELLTETILRNILQNTVKYSQLGISDPRVNIKIAKEDPYYTITVEDNGIGIRDEFKEKIFEPFVRANDSAKGTGLGLYIVTNALDKLGGKIELVRSAPYKGSVFKLYFRKQQAA